MRRREVLKLSALGAVALGAGALPAMAQSARRPNVIVILTDDQGYGDFSINGNPVVKTPNMDRIAHEGVRFEDFHVTPVCTPTRGELMTGADCLRNLACAVTAGRTILRRDMPTMAQLFKTDGYATGLFGKWHLGHSYPDRPMDRGFDKAVWFKGWGLQSEIEFDNDYVTPRYLDGLEEKRSDKYCTDLWFDEALAWMGAQQEAGRPFLAFIPTNAPHLPMWAPPEYADRYTDQEPQLAAFFQMIANLDDNIGRVDRWLRDSGAYQDTAVVFLTDNGGTLGRFLFNSGLREFKSSHYEGGHRGACFLRWPGGGWDADLAIDTPTQVQDLLPTLLDICAVPAAAAAFDGVSLVPLMRTGEMADRMFVVQFGLRERPVKYEASVIWNRWRLQKGTELYDIAADRGQESDIAAQHPDVVERMRAFYDAWWAEREAGFSTPVPMLLGTGVEPQDNLTCIDWWEVDCDNINFVSNGTGGPRGGVWHVEVVSGGTYSVELRRWPFHSDSPIGSEGPRMTITGRPLTQPVKLMPATEALFAVNGAEQSVETTPETVGATLQLTLQQGPARLQAWFRGEDGEDLCGAYYARFTKIA